MPMKRDDYKAVKRMNREQMSAYLQRIYRRGYDAGIKSLTASKKKEVAAEQPSPADASEDANG